jgi:signal transduction histidine kinase
LEDIRSQLTVPLKVLERASYGIDPVDRTIGVLDMGSIKVGAFSEESRQLLEALAAQVSVAIQNARLFGRVRDERATLEAIINGTDDAIIITDVNDRVLFFNPAAQEAFRYGEPISPGCLLYDAISNESLSAFWRQAQWHEPHSTEIPLPDGRTLHASITFVQEVGKVAVMQDITYLKELDQIKSEFVSTVSHDLRSPLQVIQTSAELLPRLGEVNHEQQREIEHILAIVRRISNLVQNLLDIGRIEAGVGMDIEPCAIDEIIASAAGACRSLAQSKGLEFDIDLPRALPLVKGNPLRLDQIVSNLVNNAIKFTSEGSISVRAWAEGEWVTMEISDTGIGIPQDAQERLFQKFYRVKSPETRGIPGTGLGLAIVKSIVEGYGGEIRVESFPRLGSTFTVMLPVYHDTVSEHA